MNKYIYIYIYKSFPFGVEIYFGNFFQNISYLFGSCLTRVVYGNFVELFLFFIFFCVGI